MTHEKFTPLYTQTKFKCRCSSMHEIMIRSRYDYKLRRDSERKAYLIFLSFHVREKIVAKSRRQLRC